MNVILGSGIVAMLAKEILPGNWTVVPFKRSRFFSFTPPLDENFIIRDAKIDEFMSDLCKARPHPGLMMRGFSIDGEIVKPHQNRFGLAKKWLYRRFGGDIPSIAETYMMDHLTFAIYDTRVHELYRSLVEKHINHIQEERTKGEVTQVGSNYIVRNGKTEEFDNAVSTIPLNVLLQLMGVDGSFLKYRPLLCLHVKSHTLDFEGCSQLLVADSHISFFKADKVTSNEYIFWFDTELQQPAKYLMSIIGNFDLLNGTTIPDALLFGDRYIPKEVDDASIFCVGSYAENDWCADIATNIIRLVNYSSRLSLPGH